MTAEIPYVEPDSLAIGDSAKWLLHLPDYLPADGWTLEYAFVCTTGQFTLSGADYGNGDWLVTLDAATSAGLTVGTYYYEVRVTSSDSTQRVPVRKGRIEFKPDFGTQDARYDNRSHVKKTLDAINALLENRASADVDSYTINGRSLVKMKPTELLTWKFKYEALYRLELNAEKVARGDRTGGKIRTRFNAYSIPSGFGRIFGRR